MGKLKSMWKYIVIIFLVGIIVFLFEGDHLDINTLSKISIGVKDFIIETVRYLLAIDIVSVIKENKLNARELSSCIWILILLAFISSKKEIREGVLKVCKQALNKKLMIPAIIFGIYNIIIVFALYRSNLWGTYLLKDTIVWFVFSGIVILFKAISGSKNKEYFKNIVIDNLKISILLQFVLNEYTMNILLELLIIPVSVILGGMAVIIDKDDKYDENIKKIITTIQAIIGTCIIYNSFKLAIIDINNFGDYKTITKIIIPIILSLLSIIPAYILALCSAYEVIFIRVSFYKGRSKSIILYIKLNIILYAKFNVNKLNRLWRDESKRLFYLRKKSEVNELFKNLHR